MMKFSSHDSNLRRSGSPFALLVMENPFGSSTCFVLTTELRTGNS
jgi:hypothetical protein